ncbi:HINT domain-containing protein [Streptomyces sp. NBC_01511]|uniref:polymorphic toxin-type HINT domain-containing protein n=1 Tax=Streptomyces sp. NBC_01511 TaxID=2903889 RepID=UPI003862FEB7
MADGTRKPIKDIQIGDQVLATDPETGESGPRPVTALIKGTGDKQLVDITLDTGKTSTLTATDGHPFWVPALGRWTEADDLTTGQWLQTSTGTWTQITAITHHTKSTTVYNLTVNDIHTYYALAGATPVLVHNVNEDVLCNLTLGPSIKGKKAEGVTAERGDKVLAHEQRMMNEFGDRNGCASCGANKSGHKDGRWTGDHNPPYKIAPNGPWTLYPHCKACSRQQGGIVRTILKEYYDFPVWKP